ncbi:MAG: class I SAM-dependent methyltransferase [Pseudomonadota bacterium]
MKPMRAASQADQSKAFRPPPDQAALTAQWLQNYDSAHYERGLAAGVLTRTHALIERDFDESHHFGDVLEVGAGTLAHLPFVRHRFDRYLATDHDDRTLDAVRGADLPAGVELMRANGSDLPFPDSSFDRLIATHVLEHMPDPTAVLTEWSRVLKPGGVLSIILPCDPGLAWRLGRSLGPRKRGEEAGLPYDYFMAREHINSIFNLKHILAYHLPKRREYWWPLRISVPDLNLIYAVNAYV